MITTGSRGDKQFYATNYDFYTPHFVSDVLTSPSRKR